VQILIRDNYEELSKTTAAIIVDVVKHKSHALLCFPSGESPIGTYRYLVKYAQERKVDFSHCRFIGLDEWVGIDGRNPGSCRYYLDKHLFSPLQIKPDHIQLFDGCAPDLDQECRRLDEYIRAHGPIELLLAGIGLNGHIGLNEPGTSFECNAHHVLLDEVTKTVAQKYFDQETPLQKGITLGLRQVSGARVVVMLASGASKAAIVAQALTGPITSQVPASILQIHHNSIVVLDEAAAADLRASQNG
jgi:glucosamine-6-phosphate isomerase